MLLAFPNDRTDTCQMAQLILDVCQLAHYSYTHEHNPRTTLPTISGSPYAFVDADNASVGRSGFRDVQGSSLG